MSLHSVWRFITDFGDTAVTVPLAVLMTAFLLAAKAWRLAVGWAVAITICAGVIGGLKIVLGTCFHAIAGMGLSSPSGHTAMSTVVYGSLALLVRGRFPARLRYPIYLGTTLAVVAIAASRVVLHEHNLPEIVIGFAVGAAAVALFASLSGRHEPPNLPLRWLAVCGLVLVAALHGTRWQIEPVLHRLAEWFRVHLTVCR